KEHQPPWEGACLGGRRRFAEWPGPRRARENTKHRDKGKRQSDVGVCSAFCPKSERPSFPGHGGFPFAGIPLPGLTVLTGLVAADQFAKATGVSRRRVLLIKES